MGRASIYRDASPRNGLGVAWTGFEDHPPEPPGLGPVAALLGQDGQVAQGEVAIDALLVGTLESQDPPPASFGLASKSPATVERQFGKLLCLSLTIMVRLIVARRLEDIEPQINAGERRSENKEPIVVLNPFCRPGES